MDVVHHEWSGCYDDGWGDLIVPDAYAHPAKFSRGLIRRIYEHLLGSGRIHPGATVVDPFGGVALGALDAMMHGLHWVGCELEPKFVDLGQRNIAMWRTRWGHATTGTARLVQGDSRRLAEVLGLADAIVSSPPYNKPFSQDHNGKRGGGRANGTAPSSERGAFVTYGQTPGQIEGLPMGDIEAVVSSPPFSPLGCQPVKRTGSTQAVRSEYNKIGESPESTYGDTAGQLGALPTGSVADAVVSSPPYEHCLDDRGRDPEKTAARKARFSEAHPEMAAHIQKPVVNYGRADDGNLGNEQGETFWSAARLIVAQSFAILRPGGVAVWVCKDFVRAKKRVPFSADWARLCESVGFVLVEWIKASLVKRVEEPSLFGGVEVKQTERKSFFRRLAEKKNSPRIDEEDVLVLLKPE